MGPLPLHQRGRTGTPRDGTGLRTGTGGTGGRSDTNLERRKEEVHRGRGEGLFSMTSGLPGVEESRNPVRRVEEPHVPVSPVGRLPRLHFRHHGQGTGYFLVT